MEHGVIENASAAPQGVSEAAHLARLDELRKKFEEGITKFQAAGKSLYNFPWYMIVGEPGSGKTEAVRHCNVGFPAGLQDGQKIRLKGEGEAGDGGAPSGDLLLTVRIAEHPQFTRNGLDTESSIDLDIVAAALGSTVDVETIHGPVELKVPAGVQPGTRMRLKDRGVSNHAGKRGDHFVRIEVKVPRELTERQRELLEEFRDAGDTEAED